MAIDFPTSPATNDRYIATNGWLYFYADSGWTTYASTISPNPFSSNQFRYRSIYTRGYVAAGYANSTPWTNVNRTQHATDITTNLGDILDRAAGYVDGGYSDYNAYIYGMSNGINTGANSTYTSSYSLTTEAGRTHSTSWDTTTTRTDCGVLLNASLTVAYIAAGGTANTDKHNYVTETMYVAGTAPAQSSVASYAAAFFGETKGWIAGTGTASFLFTTETWTNGGLTFGTEGHSKALGTKHGFAYGHNGGNTATAVIYKWNDTTGATLRTDLSTPDASGEENFEIGQDKGYCLGNYNGVQNNNSYKVNYLTDAIAAMGADTMPKGHTGMSSAANSSASAYRLGGL
jgi:hypothetical protein